MAALRPHDFGLSDRDLQTLRSLIEKYPDVQKVFIYGCRARGNAYAGSDIDLAVMNEGGAEKVVAKMKADFQDSTLPYFVDVINYPALKHADLKNHTDRAGLPFYQKKGG